MYPDVRVAAISGPEGGPLAVRGQAHLGNLLCRGAEMQEHWEHRSHAVKKSHIQFMLQLKRKKSCRQGRRPSLHANIQLLACINPKQLQVSHSTFRQLVVYMSASRQSVCMQTSRCLHASQTHSHSACRHPDAHMKSRQTASQHPDIQIPA